MIKDDGSKADRIRAMLVDGVSYKQIRNELGVAVSTVAYHAKKLGRQQHTFVRREHDWAAIQAYYDEGYTYKEVAAHFGLHASLMVQARQDGRFTTERTTERRASRSKRDRKGAKTASELFVENSTTERSVVRGFIIRHGTIPFACSGECSIAGVINPTWAGRALSLHLDHRNGIRDDHRLENLRWLCPNCHSQTETYCGRNKGK